MKINYFQQGGSTPYRTAHPELAYNVKPETEILYDVIGPLSQRTIMDQAKALRDKVMQQPKPIAFNSVNDDIINQVIRGKFGNGQARIDALTAAGYDPKEVQAAVNARFSKSVTPKQEGSAPTQSTVITSPIVSLTPAPLQTQPSVTTVSMPVYNANGNPTGEQKTMYFGRGQQPRQQTTVASAPTQPQTTTSATQQTATQQQPAWRPGMPYPSLPKFEGPTLWDDVKNVASGITSATAKVRNAQRQSGYSAGNYTSSRNPGLQGVVDVYSLPEWQPSTTYSEIADRYRKANGFKYGGSINYFQQGGQIDIVTKVIRGLNSNPEETLASLSQLAQQDKAQFNGIIQEIVKRAQDKNNPQIAQEAAQAVQVLQQAMQGGQQAAPQQAPVAKNGAKLNYLKQLKGKCPEGEELVYMKKGGVVCPVCQKKKNGGEAKAPKKEFFGKDKKIAKAQEGTKTTEPKILGIDRKKDQKNSMATYQFPDSTSRSMMINQNLPYPIYVNTTPKDTTFAIVGDVGRSESALPDSLKQKAKISFREALKWPKTATNELPVWDELFFKKGGKVDKKQFFKKEAKKPLDKCGGKMKAKKK